MNLARGMKAAVCGAALLAIGAGAASAQVSCDSLKGLQFPDVRVTDAVAAATPVPHCKVSGVIGKELKFAVWMPDAWNGKFVMGGQGGFAGTVESQAMALGALQKGYATAGTDTGHVSTGPAAGNWALGEMERIVNYGHLGIHRTTQVAKTTVSARYGRAAAKSYFAGCSNGGRQALMSAQRYPEDFDAIVAGAPALDFHRVSAQFVTITQKVYPNPNDLSKPVLGKPDREALGKAILAACDEDDGLKDGILGDPTTCRFKTQSMACRGGNTDTCLSKPELAAVNAIHNGPAKGINSRRPGFPFGGEQFDGGWGAWLTGAKDALGPGTPSLALGFGVGLVKYFVTQDVNYNYMTYDPARPPPGSDFILKTLSANNPDLSAFRARGGKLLMYHGWSDSALSPYMSLDYVDAVYGRDAAARGDVRLFMLPGVLHCTGGPGPDRLDALDAIDAWAGGGAAPEELTVGFAQGGGARKVCAYPKKPVFKGQGDGRSPDQFECK
jgi:hypothetical protein